jgi:hypothetical protein
MKTRFLLSLLLVSCAWAQTTTSTKTVTKTVGTNALTEDLTVPSGRTVTFSPGAAITLPDNALQIADVSGLQGALDGKQPLAAVLTGTTASFTTALETKLNGIAAGAEVNVNADWNASSGDAQILNKPTLGTAAALDAASGSSATATQLAKGNDARWGKVLDNSNPGGPIQVMLGYSGSSWTVQDAAGLKTALGLPTFGTVVTKNFNESGNALTSQVVIGNDTRLSDARTPLAHNQAWSTITATPTTLSGYGITDGITSATAASTYQPLTAKLTSVSNLTQGGMLWLNPGNTVSSSHPGPGGIFYGNPTGNTFNTLALGTSGQWLRSNGTNPEWASLAASATTDTTNASNITTGTLADARLSANVPLLSAANTFTGAAQSSPAWLLSGTGATDTIATNQNGLGWADGRVTLQTPVGALQFYSTGSPSQSVIYWPGVINVGTLSATTLTGDVPAANITAGTSGTDTIETDLMRRSLPSPLRGLVDGSDFAGLYGITYRTGSSGFGTEPTPGNYFVKVASEQLTGGSNYELVSSYRTAAQMRGDLAASVRSLSANATLLSTDSLIICTGAGGITLTLPAANALNPRAVQLDILNRTSGNVILTRAGSDLFEGQTTATIASGASWSITSDGSTNWYLY